MRFTLTFECESAAFDAIDPEASETAHQNERNTETARILRYVAERVEHNTTGPVRDVNGNTVGSYGFFDTVSGQDAHVS
jgi:hypothetical protein